MGNNHGRTLPKTDGLKDEVIRVPKVYDWVTDAIPVTQTIHFTEEQLEEIEFAMENPARRPLRIVAEAPKTPPVFPLNHSGHEHEHHEDFSCEQIGEKRHVTVPIDGDFVNAELVDLLFNAEIKIKVVDRHGEVVTSLKTDVTALESFVLCYPDGTDLLCRISKILTRIPSGTLILNTPVPKSFNLEVVFCADVQIEAEVKLEILAKFSSPRDNNLVAPDPDPEQCPTIEFPEQCPKIFPRHDSHCEAKGEAAGHTGSHAKVQGEAAILLNLCSNCNLANSQFEFTFNGTAAVDDLHHLNFVATAFNKDSIDCKCDEKHEGHKIILSGTGETDNGRTLDFNLAVVDRDHDDNGKFQVQLVDPDTGKIVLDTDVVTIEEGRITIKSS